MDYPKHRFQGQSNRLYTYYVTPLFTDYVNQSGNYAICRDNFDGTFYVYYFGETDDLGRRHNGGKHEKLAKALKLGATHILTHLNGNGFASRYNEERDLVERFKPPLNIEHNPMADIARVVDKWAGKPASTPTPTTPEAIPTTLGDIPMPAHWFGGLLPNPALNSTIGNVLLENSDPTPNAVSGYIRMLLAKR
jgi:hypothetical protein